jgi:septation ring formation regulator EzrA
MLFAELSRGDAAAPDMITRYSEVYRNMDLDIYEVTEILTGLNVPEILDQLESLNREIELQKGKIELQKVKIGLRKWKIESQKVLIESLSVAVTNSVRALRDANFTAEEISEVLKLDLSEVNRILKADGGGA